MGSGSSKGPSSRRGGGGGLTGGPSGQHQHQGQGPVGSSGTRPSPPSSPGLTAPPSILQAAAAPPPPPPSPPPDPDLELLEQVLEECGDEEEDDVLQKLRLSPPGGHFAPSPPSPPPLRLDAGDLGSWRPPQDGVGDGGAEGTRPQEKKQELPQKAARATPESNIFANQAPPKDPDRLAKTSYDYSEEELMATIEQEYCR